MMAARLVSSVNFEAEPAKPTPSLSDVPIQRRSRTTCGPYPHATSDSPLLESDEPVELAADELLPNFVFLPRQDLEFASDQTSGSQTLLECVRVSAVGIAECDAHVVDVPVEWAREDEPSVLC